MFVARDETTPAHQPREEAFDQPATAVARQLATVLGLLEAIDVVRGDHVDALRGELCVEPIAVVGLVADEPDQASANETLTEGIDDERRFMARTTRDPNRERKTIAVRDCHDLGCGSTSSNPDESAPLLAPA